MNRAFALGLTMVLIAAAFPALGATGVKAQRPAGASFDVQGQVAAVGDGWFQLSVQRVFRGKLARGAKVRVMEGASTRFLRAGKPAAASDLKAGLVVRVVGIAERSGKQATYRASTVTLLK